MSGVTPCLWFASEALQAAEFYVSLRPNSRIDRVQTNIIDSPAGKAGSVLVVAFTLDGSPFLALNGGQPVAFTHAISFSLLCADQAEVDRLWAALCDGGQPGQCGWLTDPYGISWQIVPEILPKLLGDPDPGRASRVMQAMMQMGKLDIAALENA